MDQEADNVTTLLGMGFPDADKIRKALRQAKNDLNEAISILTSDQPDGGGSYSPDPSKDEPPPDYSIYSNRYMKENTGVVILDEDAVPSSSYQPLNAGNELGHSTLDFPSGHLYELESRIFRDQWSIPYKKDESFGKCLIAAINLASEGLAEADACCKRFLDTCVPEAFKKLLTSGAVRTWGIEIQEGVYNMLQLFIDFIVIRLKYDPVPEKLLYYVLTMAFDPDSEFHIKNKSRLSSTCFSVSELYTGEHYYAKNCSIGESYGWLINVINKFGEQGGFQYIQDRFISENVTPSGMTALLIPFGKCARFLNTATVGPLLHTCVIKAEHYIRELKEEVLKNKEEICSIMELLKVLRQLSHQLWPQEVDSIITLHFTIILRMLRCSQFNARMNGLKEISRLIEESTSLHYVPQAVDSEKLLSWISENQLLLLSLESNLDQAQYAEKINVIVDFLGPKLSLEDITKVWTMQEGQNLQTVDNILSIMAAAAAKFNSMQFEHLLSLIQKSWTEGHEQMRKMLICFVGKLGRETSQGRSSTKVVDLLWDLVHSSELSPGLVELALQEAVSVLNEMLVNKDQVRKQYILQCIDDIKKGTCVIPCFKMLHNISRNMLPHGSYQKHDKASLHDLNKTHDLIKLVTTSLSQCYKHPGMVSGTTPVTPLTLASQKYTHEEFVSVHLDFLKFILQEGSQYLPWHRAQDVWDALVLSPNASESDKETCFDWFIRCLQDLETDTQLQLFQQKLLKLDCTQITQKGFNCFKTYFESVNIAEHRLRKYGSTLMVEKLDLIGFDFLWQVALACPDEVIAEYAVANILDVSYHSLAPRLKKDPVSLHQNFFAECRKRLETILSALGASSSPVSTAVSHATKTLTAMSVSGAANLPPPSRTKALQHIHRLLQLAECYLSSVEALHKAPRTILPHGASFHGYPITILVNCDIPNNREMIIRSHSNETFGSLRQRIAHCAQQSMEQISIAVNDAMVPPSKNQKLLWQLGFEDHQVVNAKTAANPSQLQGESTFTFQPLPQQAAGGACGASTSSAGSRQSYHFEQEKMLPGVVMSTGGQMYSMLYRLVSLDDPKILQQVRSLLHLLPTDPDVLNALDSISDKKAQGGLTSGGDNASSPRSSPRSSPKKLLLPQKESLNSPQEVLKKLFAGHAGISSFCLLYNLEALSGKLMPTVDDVGTVESAKHFGEAFQKAGGLELVLDILRSEDRPVEVDHDIWKECYFTALQIARFLLCGVAVVDMPKFGPVTLSVPIMKSIAPKRTAVDVAPLSMSAELSSATCCEIKYLSKDSLVELMSCIIRFSWIVAGGQQQITTQGCSSLTRTSDRSSQGSSSTVSSTGTVAEQGDVCIQPIEICKRDIRLAKEALGFLVTCFQNRPELFDSFAGLPYSSDFVGYIILRTPSAEIRAKALEQFSRLARMDFASSSLGSVSPRHYFLKVLRTARVPLWMSSSVTRSSNLRLVNQSKEFFELLCHLLAGCTIQQQESLNFDAREMLSSEIEWLQSFSPSAAGALQTSDSVMLSGHFKLIKHLLSCEGIDKEDISEALILDIINQFVFRASHLISEGTGSGSGLSANLMAKCSTPESRIPAYEVLIELATGCPKNLKIIVSQLIKIHHHFKPGLSKEFEYDPLVVGRAPCGYVGLKNGGATCYMNSVLQQLFMQPGVREAVLSIDEMDPDEDSLFYQLQMVFGHLLESHLQYHTPERFWKSLRLGGRPVNVREQQDAFEFFSHIADQVDEHLKKKGFEMVFKQKYEGVFSDQKLCQGCTHRYEREEAFMALNLPIKTHNLLDALDQFVKGEILEGDNAYFCEKCGEKRTTVKRTCIQTLPPVLVIQLKRFGYDWEANKAMKFDDYFKFPWMLDMKPYTSEGLQQQSTNRASESDSTSSCQYELVGVVVHSGQSNAGHYYSYIKERSLSMGANRGKWYKFNDTTVDEYDMNNESLEAECFGGTYKAMVGGDSGSPYPETRQRYWNAYMLFYECVDDPNRASWTPRKNPSMQFSFKSSEKEQRAKKPSSPAAAKHRDSLRQLTQLVDRGEQQGLFVDTIPAYIQRVVREENLQFLHNCDVYNEDYFYFIHKLVRANIDCKYMEDSELLVYSLQLGIHFLLNTYLRTKAKTSQQIQDWLDCLEGIIKRCRKAAYWLMDYFATDAGLCCLKPFLLECPNQEIRQTYGTLLEKGCQNFFYHGGSMAAPFLNHLLEYLLEMLYQDVPDNCHNCSQYFHFLSTYVRMGKQACMHLFEKNAFQKMLIFLLGPNGANMENEEFFPRRWSLLQTKEFGCLYTALATLILSCDLTPQKTCDAENHVLQLSAWSPCNPDIPLPDSVSAALFGPGSGRFIQEMVNACREVSGSMLVISDMILHCSFCNETFSFAVIKQILLQYSCVPSNELRNLSSLLCELLLLEDPLQFTRIRSVINGFTDSTGTLIGGMLDIIGNNQHKDSRRSYQGVKFLVVLAQKCTLAKDYLIQTPNKWQWAVKWLKMMMSEHSSLNTQSVMLLSNEDSNTKVFQRTISAQDTLADATALLTELESPLNQEIMDVDEDDSSPSQVEENPSLGSQQLQQQSPTDSNTSRDGMLKRVKAMEDLDAIYP